MKKILDDTGLSYFYGKMKQTFATQSSVSSKANSADLATVATSGSYNDLSNKPTIPTKTSDLENDSGFLKVAGSDIDQDLYVDMGLPSGTLWAKKNIDVTQANGFAASEYQYECSFFSWGNVDGHNPTSTSSFGNYSFSSSNTGLPYVSSEGAKISYPDSADSSHDAAYVNIGDKWRMPATEDFAELFDSNYTKFIDANGNDIANGVTNKIVTVNSINGIRLKSKINGNIIFFPCSGLGSGSSWKSRGSYGYYWSRSLSSAGGRGLSFYSGGVGPQYNGPRSFGFAVRPVINANLAASRVAISGDYNDLINKPTIPTVPSNQSAASGGTTLSVVTTGEKYTWNNKANVWRGTQAQYDAITTPDANTIYIITSAS